MTPIAWRILMHGKLRTLLAVAGIAFAVMLTLLQLGLYHAVATGATAVTDQLDYDLVLVSKNYTSLRGPEQFSRRRLFQASAVPGVAETIPIYISFQNWRNEQSGKKLTIFVMGAAPHHRAFIDPEVQAYQEQLQQADTFILDRASRDLYGEQRVGRVVEIGGRRCTMVGTYSIGIGFLDLGAMIVSDQNFQRLYAGRSLGKVQLGLIRLKPDHDAQQVAQQLRHRLLNDVHVWTRNEFNQRERKFWTTVTSIGMMFGSGVLVAVVVGVVILYRTLSSQVTSYLPQYATLKALGYSNERLSWIVLQQAAWLSLLGFVPGLFTALWLYALIEQSVNIVIAMTAARLLGVLLSSLLLSVAAGLLALRRVHRLDPADLF